METDFWDRIYEATQFTPRCAQEDFGGDQTGVNYTKEFYSNPEFERETSEDCLYLHIWTPKEAKEEKLPVAFWLHGGAFMGGFSSEMEFDANPNGAKEQEWRPCTKEDSFVLELK